MNSQTIAARQSRRWRSMLWSLAAIIVLAVALPSIGYMVANAAQVYGPEREFSENSPTNPRSDMWRDARQGNAGTTTQSGPYVTDSLISNVGQNWRQIRGFQGDGDAGPLITYSGWALLIVLILLSAFFAVRGGVKLEQGRSGMTVQRWKGYERFIHWFTALTFIVLAITGLSLLFGRSVLIPLFGLTGFAGYAQWAMNVHNVVGPVFTIGVLAMVVLWAKDNIPTRVDLEWFKRGGGIFTKGHPSAGRMNGGEKAWFWGGVFGLGLIVSISGFIMVFPNLGFQTRDMMAWSQVIHAVAAVIWVALFFGHVYIGTLGTEGVLEGMTRGRVDVNWAKQHHNLWYEDLIAKGEQPVPEADLQKQGQGPAATGGASGQPGH